MAKDTRPMFSALEVCELLGITLNNLRQITFRGDLTPIKKKIGKYKQYPQEDVFAYKGGARKNKQLRKQAS